MTFDFFDFFSQALIITFIVVMLMTLIEFMNVKTRGRLLLLLKRRPGKQLWLGALLGLFPGCIGIFAVVSLYTQGLVGFGVLLSASITSFGDEAFFMISLIPRQTFILVFILFALAILSGYVVVWLSRKRQSSVDVSHEDIFALHSHDICTTHDHPHTSDDKNDKHVFGVISLRRILVTVVVLLFIVGIMTGFLSHGHLIADTFSISAHTESCSAHQDGEGDDAIVHAHAHDDQHAEHDHSPFSGENLIFLIVAFFTFVLLLTVNNHFFEVHIWRHVIRRHCFKIFIWVFVITLVVKLIGLFSDADILYCLSWGRVILLFFALLLAVLPESGPNLIVLFLFIDGFVPFSTLLANSILQEGHGGLPLIAEKPKSFVRLKLIKFVIALIVGILGLCLGF
jgi:hypothetical protein